MKKGSEFLVLKFVYRSICGLYYREDSSTGSDISLAHDFAIVDRIASLYPSFKVVMHKKNREITAWKDKHNNVIVRVIDKSFVQSKINF